MALNLARIIGTITGKIAFERTDANFQAIQTDVNANTTAIDGKLPTSHNTDVDAHDDIRQQINSLATYKGALVVLNANQSIPHNTLTAISWSSAIFDNIEAWNIGNPTRLTVPVGAKKVIISGNTRWAINETGLRLVQIAKNGGGFAGMAQDQRLPSQRSYANLKSAVINVNAGDYFELKVIQNSGGGALNFEGDGSGAWFAMEVVEWQE